MVKLKKNIISIHKIVQGVRTQSWHSSFILINFLFMYWFYQTKAQNDLGNEYLNTFGTKMEIGHQLCAWACAQNQ